MDEPCQTAQRPGDGWCHVSRGVGIGIVGSGKREAGDQVGSSPMRRRDLHSASMKVVETTQFAIPDQNGAHGTVPWILYSPLGPGSRLTRTITNASIALRAWFAISTPRYWDVLRNALLLR